METVHLDGITKENLKKINRIEILKQIPKHCLEKNLFLSMYYGIRDSSLAILTYFAYYYLLQTQIYQNCPSILKFVFYIFYCFFCGFWAWCLFVVGHDCGHGSFSNSIVMNDIFGNIFHGAIMVPFWPWALSHNRHHCNHNHKQKDYSNPWHTAGSSADHTFDYCFPIMPIIAWQVYLTVGWSDGIHWVPMSDQKLYANATQMARFKCIFSSLICMAYLYLFYQYFGNWLDLVFYYGGAIIGFGFWLFTVTYYQHHGPHSIVYDDKNWNYEFAAFQTIDRSFGTIIDYLHHRITDCHVLHHILFTKIPHYHLKEANLAFIKYLKEEGLLDLYQFQSTRDFAWKIFYDFGKYRFCYKYYINEKNANTENKEVLFAMNKLED